MTTWWFLLSMGRLLWAALPTLLLLHLAAPSQQTATFKGVVELDSVSFNKTLAAFKHSFVKFHSLSETAATSSDEDKRSSAEFGVLAIDLKDARHLLLAQVNIDQNDDLARRFRVQDRSTLPEYILMSLDANKSQTTSTTRYGGRRDHESFWKFLKAKTRLKLTLPGCLPKFDALSEKFAKSATKGHRAHVETDLDNLIDQAENLLEDCCPATDPARGKKRDMGLRYIKHMKAFRKKAEVEGWGGGSGDLFDSWRKSEVERLKNILFTEEKNLAMEKRLSFVETLNMLKSFQEVDYRPNSMSDRVKDEL